MTPYPSTRKSFAIIALICSIYFLLFSFFYLYFLQSELFRIIHVIKSGKEVVYYPLWGALILTCILWIAQFGLNYLTRFKGKWHALSFCPAFGALIMLTDVQPIIVDGKQTLLYNWEWWQAILVAVIYIVTAYIYQKQFEKRKIEKSTLTEMLIPNFVILTFLSCTTGIMGNSNDTFYYELKIAQALREQNPQKALLVGEKSLTHNHSMTTLRNYALAQTDSLGDAIFCYPQTYGSNGLLFENEDYSASGFSNHDIYQFIGASPKKKTETITRYLQRLCEEEKGNHNVLDYYLCALLLERQLSAFVKAMEQFYDFNETTTLPKHYQEALLLHQIKEREHPDTILIDIDTRNRYTAFDSLQNQYSKAIEKTNYTRRKFGDTYWWYYWYGE